MFHLISIGLFNENDMSVNAVETAMHCDELFVEFYTSQLETSAEKLAGFIGKPVKELKREEVENSRHLLELAKERDVGLLVGGECLTATTHISLIIDAKKAGIPVNVVHGSSVYTAVCKTGLQIYKFGRTTTLPKFKAVSCYEVIEQNLKAGLHTLVLLDIGMKIPEALSQLLELESECKRNVFSADTKMIACCRLGGKDEVIKYGKVSELASNKNLEKVQALLVIPGELHFKEEEALEMWR